MTLREENVIREARRILGRHLNLNPVIGSWDSLMDYCALTVRGPEERFHVLYLDSKNRIISDEQLSTGTVDHVPVYPREVIKRALLLNASALILVHNHPSGDPTPSEPDIVMTAQIQDGAAVLGITLHDHVIVGANQEISLRTLGVL
ncbi:MAG: DNA repair protein [Cereibacter sphaeroides]|uniref:DNA repair protein n=1 Tax=Cereibacter sphaeroides TaxID=1063 RepID=A0A2W5RZZ3_CERSP|nr:MAG: DNA repair protein [Cereibacter sphaeroides]